MRPGFCSLTDLRTHFGTSTLFISESQIYSFFKLHKHAVATSPSAFFEFALQSPPSFPSRCISHCELKIDFVLNLESPTKEDRYTTKIRLPTYGIGWVSLGLVGRHSIVDCISKAFVSYGGRDQVLSTTRRGSRFRDGERVVVQCWLLILASHLA